MDTHAHTRAYVRAVHAFGLLWVAACAATVPVRVRVRVHAHLCMLYGRYAHAAGHDVGGRGARGCDRTIILARTGNSLAQQQLSALQGGSGSHAGKSGLLRDFWITRNHAVAAPARTG